MSDLIRLMGRNSPQFQRYLNQQTPERASEIRAAERLYSESRQFTGEIDPMERAYEESFLGFYDNAAGTCVRYRDPNSGEILSKRLDEY